MGENNTTYGVIGLRTVLDSFERSNKSPTPKVANEDDVDVDDDVDESIY